MRFRTAVDHRVARLAVLRRTPTQSGAISDTVGNGNQPTLGRWVCVWMKPFEGRFATQRLWYGGGRAVWHRPFRCWAAGGAVSAAVAAVVGETSSVSDGLGGIGGADGGRGGGESRARKAAQLSPGRGAQGVGGDSGRDGATAGVGSDSNRSQVSRRRRSPLLAQQHRLPTTTPDACLGWRIP